MIRAIVALDLHRGIAKDGKIPWDLPEDRQYFKEKTAGAVVLMGRGTYHTLTAPLPGRTNLVLTHKKRLRPGFIAVRDLVLVIESYPDLWIIGGADVYAQALPYCQELYITHVAGDYACDRFFPAYKSMFKSSRKQGIYFVYQQISKD